MTTEARLKIKKMVESLGLEHARVALGGCSCETVRRYINGERTPSDDRKVEIDKLTSGAISILDWFVKPADSTPTAAVHDEWGTQ